MLLTGGSTGGLGCTGTLTGGRGLPCTTTGGFGASADRSKNRTARATIPMRTTATTPPAPISTSGSAEEGFLIERPASLSRSPRASSKSNPDGNGGGAAGTVGGPGGLAVTAATGDAPCSLA